MLSWGIWRMRHVFVEIYLNSLIFPSLFGDKPNSFMSQPSTYIFPFPFGLPFHSGRHTELSRISCAIQQVLISHLFIHRINSVYVLIPISQFLAPTLPSPWHLYIFVLCVCVSIYALQIRSYIFRYKVSQHLQVAQFCNLMVMCSPETTCRIKQPLN